MVGRGEGRASCLSKVPGFAVDVDAGTVDTVPLQSEGGQRRLDLLHGAHQQVPHDVEPEAVHLH